ncbi:N-carbamoyl-D-amino-acid hydrolase [Roseomonas sp. OT10]|uniref:N-carbamoyl-D-amino-acid hydrolase n=1 Tax=Roseomonas cutis TaxID=2897332 RepID=UPI001E57679F|nr:N-carbamoyl-D-amino-acid hydrolase [Roseomonas sp. OT10]UFN48494.1 N-carbamoyl-D-amino-acid hydrolase [Roseomonas sp. OT10]
MARKVRVAAAQMGPVARAHSRAEVVERLLAMLRKAHGFGAELVVYPEMALTTFFPRWVFDDPDEADAFCEAAMPNPDVQPLFDEAARLGIGFYLGYAELTEQAGRKKRFNTAILVGKDGTIVGKYRKIHLPGRKEADPTGCAGNFEKRYYEVGDLGFPVFRAFGGVMGMAICNDRRWPETYRAMSLQGAELIMLGYNTGSVRRTMVGNHQVQEPAHLSSFHNHLVMQAGAYQNCCWVVGVAKAGMEEGVEFMGGSCIIAPTGDIVAQAVTTGDEVVVADCDLDLSLHNRRTTFNFEANRQIEHYGLITERRGVIVAV